MDVEKIEDAAFSFDSYQVDVKTDISIGSSKHSSTIESIKIFIDESRKIKFAYASGEGLISIGNTNTRKTNNLLGNLLKINPSNLNGFIDYVCNYGFFFPLEFDRLQKVTPTFFIKYSERLKALTELINEIGASSPNYRKIVELSFYLMFDEGWELNFHNGKQSSCHYNLADLIDDSFSLPETVNEQEAINTGSYTINDTLFGTYKLSAKDYRDIIDGYSSKKGWDDYRFKSLTYLYANKTHLDEKEQEIIDLAFHYFHEVGIPLDISIDGITYFERFNINGFDEHNMIDAILDLGEYVVSHEINHGIDGIKPVCDAEKMQSKWVIPSLNAALYFSLFYLDKSKQMYRRCEHCGAYFVVNRSTSTRKYCTSYCRNNAQQAKHRLKSKQ